MEVEGAELSKTALCGALNRDGTLQGLGRSSRRSAAVSHARAKAQSRSTVRRSMSISAAISLCENPPKYVADSREKPEAPATRQGTLCVLRPALAVPSNVGIHVDADASARRAHQIAILRAIDRAARRPLPAILRLLRLPPSHFHARRRRPRVCALDDQPSFPGLDSAKAPDDQNS
jgi:hypothetical protein